MGLGHLAERIVADSLRKVYLGIPAIVERYMLDSLHGLVPDICPWQTASWRTAGVVSAWACLPRVRALHTPELMSAACIGYRSCHQSMPCTYKRG